MRTHLSIIAALTISAVFFCGCQNAGPEKQQPEQHTPKTEKPQDIPESTINALKQKLEKDGKLFPPRPVIHHRVLRTGSAMTHSDADHAFLYKASAFKRCYMNALAFDDTLHGTATIEVERQQDGTCLLKSFQCDFKSDVFEACVKNAVLQWPLPQNATVAYAIDFSSAPPLSAQELREKKETRHNENLKAMREEQRQKQTHNIENIPNPQPQPAP